MADYKPDRPRPNIDAGYTLPGDLPHAPEPVSPAADPEPESDPASGPASHLLPRQAKPVDRRLLVATGAAIAISGMIVVCLAWCLWRRRRRR